MEPAGIKELARAVHGDCEGERRTPKRECMPSEQLLAEMGNYNEELVKAGIMLAGEGLHPSVKGKRVRFSGSRRPSIDGPFAETKELDCRLLVVASEVDGRGGRVGEALPESDW